MPRGKKRKWDDEDEPQSSGGGGWSGGGGRKWRDDDSLGGTGGGGGSANFCVALGNVPTDYTHDTIIELHEALGLEADALESTKFMPPTSMDPLGTCSAMLRYVDRHSAEQAADALRGQPVTGADNQMRELTAAMKATQGVTAVNPSVYISDVPVEYTERQLRDLHREMDPIFEERLAGFKLLNSKDPTGETRCVIARYKDDEAAERAIGLLRGKRIYCTSGTYKHLGARMAKPANWMVSTGVGDKQMAAYLETKKAKMRREEKELPQGELIKGRVKTWRDDAGFGFLTPTEFWGPDCFVHRTCLSDGQFLQVDSTVTFTAEWDAEKGKYVATSCQGALPAPDSTAALPGVAAPRELMQVPSASPVAGEDTHDVPGGVLIAGVVKYWNAEKGFGFLRPDTRGRDVYFHRHCMVPAFEVQVGAPVSFEAQWNAERGNYTALICFEGTEGMENVGTEGLAWSATAEDESAAPPADSVTEPSEELVTFAGEFNLDLPTVEWLCLLPAVVRKGIIGKFIAENGSAGNSMNFIDAGKVLRAIGTLVEARRGKDGGATDQTINAASGSTLLVTGLDADAGEDLVRELLGMHGEVLEVEMMPPSIMDRAALAKMADAAQAQLVIGGLNGMVPVGMNTPVGVKLVGGPYPPNASDNLFVAGLPLVGGEEKAREIFAQLGEVKSIKALRGRSDSAAAVVRMGCKELAQLAIDCFHDRFFEGVPGQLVIRYAESARGPAMPAILPPHAPAAHAQASLPAAWRQPPVGGGGAFAPPPPPGPPPPHALATAAAVRQSLAAAAGWASPAPGQGAIRPPPQRVLPPAPPRGPPPSTMRPTLPAATARILPGAAGAAGVKRRLPQPGGYPVQAEVAVEEFDADQAGEEEAPPLKQLKPTWKARAKPPLTSPPRPSGSSQGAWDGGGAEEEAEEMGAESSDWQKWEQPKHESAGGGWWE